MDLRLGVFWSPGVSATLLKRACSRSRGQKQRVQSPRQQRLSSAHSPDCPDLGQLRRSSQC